MLYTGVLTESALKLLKELQKEEYLSEFLLAGGTALALYLGHRKSIDIELFTHNNFDAEKLLEFLNQKYSFQIFHSATNTLKGNIDSVNVDLIAHRYPLIGKSLTEEGIHLISIEDIIAMKLNAISTSGQRSKDFVDIYYASKQFSLSEMLSLYQKKYSQDSTLHILKSLVYFDDIDLSDWPEMVKDPDLSWDAVKKIIEEMVFGYTRRNL